MPNEPEVLREIHAIREQLHHENRNLPSRERSERANREGEDIARAYGLTVRSLPETAQR